MQQIPILTYDSLNTWGKTYSSNDHTVLQSDLVTLKSLGYRELPLPYLIDRFLEGGLNTRVESRICAITFDNDVLHDFADFCHPDQGLLKSFARILSDATEAHLTGWEVVTATSFVIASSEERPECRFSPSLFSGLCSLGHDTLTRPLATASEFCFTKGDPFTSLATPFRHRRFHSSASGEKSS